MMPRARQIKPETTMDERLAALPILVRYFYVLLPTIADREGRLEDRPRKIRAYLYPYDSDRDVDVEGSIQSLQSHGFLRRYSADGKPLIQILNWHRMHKPHANEAPSEFPPLDEGLPPLDEGLSLVPCTLDLGPCTHKPPTPYGGGEAPVEVPKPKRKRRSRQEILSPFPDDLREWANQALSAWPVEDPLDGREIRCDAGVLAQNVANILNESPNATLPLLESAYRDYLASGAQRWMAPQFFFGPGQPGKGKPWLPWARAILSRSSEPVAE